MTNVAITRGPELDELLEKAEAQVTLLNHVRKLRADRSEHLRQVAEIDHALAKFEDPLRVVLLDRFEAPAEIERLTRGMNGQAETMVARERELAAALLRIEELERERAAGTTPALLRRQAG